MSTRRLVQQALRAANIRHRAQGRIVSIFCPFHEDKHSPSCAIYVNNSPPRYYCFGCSAHGDWASLQAALKLADLPSEWDDPLACKHQNLELTRMVQQDPKLPPLVRPWDQGNWRRLKQQTLTQANSLWWWDELDRVRRIVFPIWDDDRNLVGWSGRCLDNNDDVPKYRHMNRMQILSALWPLPRFRCDETVVVIVEGTVDALRLLQQGIPALSNMGCNWSKGRSALLSLLGINRVVVALDGDSAGRKGNYEIAQRLKGQYHESRVGAWEWPAGTDPGDAPIEEIRALRDFLGKPPGPHRWLEALPKLSPFWLIDTPQEKFDDYYH